MFAELKKWLSDRNNQILDKTDVISDISNTDKKSWILVNNDLLPIKDLKVFHSNQTIIESLLTNKIKPNNNVIKWLNDFKLRKQFLEQLSTLCLKSAKVLELLETIFSETTIKVSRKRTENLLKVLNYASNNAIFNNVNGIGFTNVKHSVIKLCDSQSVLLKVLNSLIPCLVNGIPVILIAEDRIAMSASFVIDLCESAGLMSGIIQLIITDKQVVEKVEETAKESNPSINVVFESADVESSIERILTSFINNTLETVNVFVQQSVYKKFCDRMKSRLSNMFVIGDPFNPMSDILSEINVDYDAIDLENSDKFVGIKVYQFRTNEEARLLINHFIEIPYICLWAEKISLAIEFAKSINSSDNMYINCSLRYPVKRETSVLEKVTDRVDLTSLSGNKMNQTLFASMLDSQSKWKQTSEEEKKKIINNFLINNDDLSAAHESNLQQLNDRIIENKDNYGIQLVISYYEPIGLILLRVDDKEFNKSTVNIVLNALLLGNCVVIVGLKTTNLLSKLSDYLKSLGKNILHLTSELDFEENANSIITSGRKDVGIYLNDISYVSYKLLKRLKRSIALPIGDINYAK